MFVSAAYSISISTRDGLTRTSRTAKCLTTVNRRKAYTFKQCNAINQTNGDYGDDNDDATGIVGGEPGTMKVAGAAPL